MNQRFAIIFATASLPDSLPQIRAHDGKASGDRICFNLTAGLDADAATAVSNESGFIVPVSAPAE